MELDNIIYIIITIIIFVVSLLGQSKKKKVEKPDLGDDVIYSLNDFEKILLRKEEFKREETIPEPPVSSEIITNEIENQDKTDEKKEARIQYEDKENDDGFDIKSAVIYSSILERKKFRR